MADADIVAVAERVADDVLFPAALATDAAETVPRENLDALADAGLYGISGPAWAGGADAGFPAVCSVFEALAGGCLTTAFVWGQHVGAVIAAAAAETEELRELVAPLCRGERRAGLALGGALPGPPRLQARRGDGGWVLSGESPWVSGWGRIDVIHTAARADDGTLVWSFVDAREGGGLSVARVPLMALDATATVQADFEEVFVPDGRVAAIVPFEAAESSLTFVLRIHASFALGVAGRCCRLLGPSPLDAQLDAVRASLDALDPDTMPAARAAASELALRASAALMSTVGSRSLLRSEHAQRLAREALFVAVYAARPPVRSALLERLGASRP